MPLTVHGDNTAPLVLPADRGKDKPRALRLKFLSKKETRQWQKKYAAAMDLSGSPEKIDERDAAYDALFKEVVVGWENIDGVFSPEAISDHYTLPEFMTLLDMVPMAMIPGVEDVKKSESHA